MLATQCKKQVQVPIHGGFRHAEHEEKPIFAEKARFRLHDFLIWAMR